MSIKIGSNISSLQAQRRLGEATSSLSKIYEQLSSGQRINRASDDAAGLAIADDLNAKTRVYTQAIRNGNDGVSLLNIADSAIEALGGIVTRMRELVEQSANGTYSNVQRDSLDNEAQALSEEFIRISQSTSFNGIKILDGTLSAGLRLQLGYGVEGSINVSIGSIGTSGGAIGTGEVELQGLVDSESGRSYALSLGDLNGDGILDLITAGQNDTGGGYATVRLGTGNGSFGSGTSFTTESNASSALSLGDLNGDGILDLITAGYSDGNDGYATVRLGTGNGSFGSATSFTTESLRSNALSLGDLNGDSILDLITTGVSDGGGGYATVRLGTGNGSFGSATSFTTESRISYALSLGDLNGDGILDLVTAGYNFDFDGYATVRIGTGNGSFGSATSFTTESFSSRALSLGDLNGDGILDLITAGQSDGGSYDGYATVRLGSGNGGFGQQTSYFILDANGVSSSLRALTLGDINGDGVNDVVTSGFQFDGGYDGKVGILLGQTTGGQTTESSGVTLPDFSLRTQADALLAMTPLQNLQDNLAKQRGEIGASQSRVAIALAGLAASRENFSAAESRIRDADIAQESSNLTRTQILQQAATSVLSQANQQPQLALTLLRGAG